MDIKNCLDDIEKKNKEYDIEINKNINTEITNLLKPLNSVSYYKVDELVSIAQKIHIPYEKVKKKDLYDSIYNYLVKLNIFKID